MFLYEEAARIIQTLKNRKGTIKSLALSSNYKNKKQLYALLCETLKFSTVLDKILEASQLRKQEKIFKSQEIAQVVLYDFLIGKGIQGSGKYKKAVYSHKAALKAELARLKIKAKAVKNEDLLDKEATAEVQLPRYVRVNLLKTKLSDVIHHFRTEGYSFLAACSNTDYERFIDTVKSLKPKQFVADYHMPDQLLVFPPGTDLHDHVLYKSGDIILQDKASCLPAFILSPKRGSHVIDCCAAPGNKTTHVAAIMQNKGKVFAFDMDARRLATMNTLTLKAGVTCVQLNNKDFLTVNPEDQLYKNVEYIIVDPSCSGSGIVSRKDYLISDEKESESEERLQNLAKFQVNILKHALCFPNAKRVVYSTCSVHETENELVVKNILDQCGDRFQLEYALPSWLHRGRSLVTSGDLCIRASPQSDLTNGFFVACFVRRDNTVCEIKTGHVESVVSPESESSILDVKDNKEVIKQTTVAEKDNEDSIEVSIENGKSEDGKRKADTSQSSEVKRKRKGDSLQSTAVSSGEVHINENSSNKINTGHIDKKKSKKKKKKKKKTTVTVM